MTKSFILFAACAATACAQVDTIEGARIAAQMKFLASDLMEGRQPGTRGGRLAEEYIATQFALAGLKPAGGKGSFYQNVPLVSVAVEGTPTFEVVKAGRTVPLKWLEEFAGKPRTQQTAIHLDAEAVFVGYGITAPEFGWDSYKGVDVKGKVVVLFTSEPPSSDPKFFAGNALTYYGRWTYKFEEAARRGAAGVLIIHTTPTASYGWNVVRGFSRSEPQVKLKPGEHALQFAGWISSEAAARAFGRDINDLLAQSAQKSFQPFPLDARIRADVRMKLENIETRNVAGLVRGSDPQLSQQVVVYTSHWDHLGVGDPVNGDAIYNGALDNASGCAMIIEMARAWASLEPKPRRSALFVAVTSEEAGMLGSQYLGENPLFPLAQTAAALNFDEFFPYGRNTDIVVTGAERTTLWPLVQSLAGRYQLTIKPDTHPEAGHYYRSDHFNLARVGVPAFSINMGGQFAGKPEAAARVKEFEEKRYHQPSDEWRDDFDFSGIEQMARFGFTLGLEIANQAKLPTWQAGDEFLPAREKSGVR
jgi:Zn-dependent M28 family amino/carboxypeptidase